MLQLSTKCWNSAFNAYGSRLIIVLVQERAVKMYVAAVEELGKKERQDETQFTTKIDGFLRFTPPSLNVNVLFCRFFLMSPCVWPNSGFWCCVCLILQITLLCVTYCVAHCDITYLYIFFIQTRLDIQTWSDNEPHTHACLTLVSSNSCRTLIFR